MFNDRDGLAEYRLLEFPNETDQSWPITQRELDQVLIPQVHFSRENDRVADAVKKVA